MWYSWSGTKEVRYCLVVVVSVSKAKPPQAADRHHLGKSGEAEGKDDALASTRGRDGQAIHDRRIHGKRPGCGNLDPTRSNQHAGSLSRCWRSALWLSNISMQTKVLISHAVAMLAGAL